MSNRPLYWFPLAIIALLAGLSMWLQYTIQSHKLGFLTSDTRIIDYMIEDFKVTRTNLAGQVIYTLNAKFAEHFLDNDTAQLTTPHLVAHDEQQGTVDIRSKQAFVTSKGKQVNFIDNVVLVRDLHDGQGPLVLTTDYLEAFPDQQLMRTSHPVQIRGNFLQIAAGGLELNNRTQTMQLSNRVKARYEPTH